MSSYAFQQGEAAVMEHMPDFLTIIFTNVQAIHCVEAQIEERQIAGYNQCYAMNFGNSVSSQITCNDNASVQN